AVPGFLLQLAVFALGFFIIAQVWQRHHRVMHYVEWVDRRDIRRTVLMLAGVASLPIAVDLVTHDAQFPEAVVIAAAMLSVTSLFMLWLDVALLRPGLAVVAPAVRRLLMIRGVYSVVVFLSAIPLAYLLPTSGRAPLVWWAMALVGPVSTGVDRVWTRVRIAWWGRSRSRPTRAAVRRGP
ncbi:MAG: TMEM175 family protein, partial [Blastococcus sp.]